MPLRERLREVFGPASSEPAAAGDTSASPPPVEVPIEADAAPPPNQASGTEASGRGEDASSRLTSRPSDLPIAQGHELLGPCRDCAGHWTRELTRGQKPLTCPVCKRFGPPT